MKKSFILTFALFYNMVGLLTAQEPYTIHPITSLPGWSDLFKADLSNAIFLKNIWSNHNGILTATKDEDIWSEKMYNNFVLDLEFKNDTGTNSGVFIHGSNLDKWIANSVEIQIADDFYPQWANSPHSWQCGAIFGHQPAKKHLVKHPGEWNHYTITSIRNRIYVVLNGELVNECDLNLFTSAKTNPDGTAIPAWLSTPLADLVLEGHIGFQGKHAGAPIYFRNIRIMELK